ncbi:alkaline phosphatase [Phenylobacterium sp. J367]|uniref:alkaline phosphatase D family protein n=1 Tax=Phenylobacterium sp. J367 TaxID=2898435 RepID=UPI0021511CCA|nr:alkaline phosphatase D family protein [Phenylobacterium sp. J367]MCR5877672.1 alkaline phosphatase D family protein [Phenylobacterium sp. J367]
MRIDRRRALALLGLGAAAPATAQTATQIAFNHGVASGDPLQDRVVIWTRISGASGQVPYRWTLGDRSGSGVTGPERDHTIKVDVDGLQPGREYRFRFEAGGVRSPEGRTKTLPAGRTKDVVLAIASCTLYPNGYFNAYRAMADLERLDAVLHLGDYIYEYGGPDSYGMNSAVAAERPHDPNREIVSLADYRTRHAQYKSDPDLQAAHARAPWIVAWDDHETANDSFTLGAQNHNPPEEGDWNVRKAAALKAYFEWMPIREPMPGQDFVQAAARSFAFGDLASLIMIETRLGARDRQLTAEADLMKDGKPDVAAFNAKLMDPARRMMSPAQEAWVGRELAGSVRAGHAWQVLGNQVIMARVKGSAAKALTPDELKAVKPEARRRLDQRAQLADLGVPAALDMWDGYPVDRERLYGLVRTAQARPIVVSGDSHSFWANELHDEQGRRLACEFGTTGITSPGAGELAPGLDWGEVIARANPEVRYNNQTAKGFVLLTLTRDAARADMVAVSTITQRQFTTSVVKTFTARPDGKGISALS